VAEDSLDGMRGAEQVHLLEAVFRDAPDRIQAVESADFLARWHDHTKALRRDLKSIHGNDRATE